MAGSRWYRDTDNELWRFSKAEGGVQHETENGRFGKSIPLWVAKEECGLEEVDSDESLVLNEFSKLNIDPHSFNEYRRIRDAVIGIVRITKGQESAKAIANKAEATNDKESVPQE